MPSLAASVPQCDESESAEVAAASRTPTVTLPISIIIPVRNEARNLPRCLESVQWAGEIYVVDSQSTDETAEVARSFGAKVVQFYYQGGWPKKRQWAMNGLPLKNDWVLLLDADEALTSELVTEIQEAIRNPGTDGYYIGLEVFFLGRRLRHSGATFYKLALFRRRKGHFECRTRRQDTSMCDMEVHEHVVVDGRVRKLKSKLIHHNQDTLGRYIRKHNEYSNWEVRVLLETSEDDAELRPSIFGSQAQRRRWLRKNIFRMPGSPLLFFLYKYFLRLGFLDGVPGLIYCAFQGIQFFHIKAKLFEAKLWPQKDLADACAISSFEAPNVRH